MKRFAILLIMIIMVQIISCSMGVIDTQPGTTKVSITNNSKKQLLNVRWNGETFGDIMPGGISEKEISAEGNGYVFFDLDNKENYRTYEVFAAEKYKRKEFPFIDGTWIIDKNDVQTTLGNI
jgi:hypothetical protein